MNSRGKRDAPLMADFLKQRQSVIGKFYSSPAVRAYTTATVFAEVYGKGKSDISIESDLYFGDEQDIMEVIFNVDDEELDSIIIFSHNPTITYFVNQFSSKYIENVPTCGVSILQSSANTWSEVNGDNTILKDSFYPKTHL